MVVVVIVVLVSIPDSSLSFHGQGSGQVVAWGAGEYGQLGSGFLWDDATPRFVVNLDNVVDISAGFRYTKYRYFWVTISSNFCILYVCMYICYRHSMAIGENPTDVYAWGYNGYGELGLG